MKLGQIFPNKEHFMGNQVLNLFEFVGIDSKLIDFAVPQSWFDEQLSKGLDTKAVWDYRKEMFGEPLYIKEVEKLAEDKAADLLEVLNKEQNRGNLFAVFKAFKLLPKETVDKMILDMDHRVIQFVITSICNK